MAGITIELSEFIDAVAEAVVKKMQEPKTGRWIYTGDYNTDGMLKCSKCGFEHDASEKLRECPNCGAKMEE